MQANSPDFAAAIVAAEIPKVNVKGRTVTATVIKRVLHFIAGFSSKSCTLPVESNADVVGIADRICTSSRTVYSAIAAASELGLMTIEGSGPKQRRFLTHGNLQQLLILSGKSLQPEPTDGETSGHQCPNGGGC
ncbi:MAG: hypothetical protein AAF394_07275 [Planctomycetota bacterium]